MQHKTSKQIEVIKKKLAPVFLKNMIEKAVVFGAMARGTDSARSDLDLMIVMDTNKRFFDRFEQFDDIYSIISDHSIDLLIYTPEELAEISHRPFIKSILKEGRVIYER